MDNNMDKYLGQTLDDRYKILEEIGSGGMSVVYRAHCNRLNRDVAVKILRDDLAVDPEFRRYFQNESQAVAMLCHPNIVLVHDVSVSSDVEYIVMELIDGITLKQYMNQKKVLSVKETLHFSVQIAKALDHAHSKGIIHRDIKPHNIMILRDGTAKVADFGIAHLQSSQAPCKTAEAVGSVHYIAPEQARGETGDARSDLYSLGIVMYEMMTGKLPFEGDSDVSVALQHLSKIPVRPRELNPYIPEAFEDIILKAMEPNINLRYQSAEELLHDLEAFRKGNYAMFTAGMAIPEDQVRRKRNGNDAFTEFEDIKPIKKKKRELSEKEYKRRKKRARRVSTLSGIFLVTVFVVAVLIFLWTYCLRDILGGSKEIDVPEFIGNYYDDIVDSDTFEDFTFTVEYASDDEAPEGMIIDQSPKSGNRKVSGTPVKVELTVSTGVETEKIPDLVNTEYRAAIIKLENLGFKVEVTNETSSTITKDYIIHISPSPNESVAKGSTVYLTVSSGPNATYVTMESLIGLTQSAANTRLEFLNLVLGDVGTVTDDSVSEGTVVWQSVSPGNSVEERSKVDIKIAVHSAEESDEPDESDSANASDNRNNDDTEGTGRDSEGEAPTVNNSMRSVNHTEGN